MANKKTSKLVSIIWDDAQSGTITRDEQITNYLIRRVSYGKLLYENDKCVVLINTEDNLGIEYTAIPRPWIIDIKT